MDYETKILNVIRYTSSTCGLDLTIFVQILEVGYDSLIIRLRTDEIHKNKIYCMV